MMDGSVVSFFKKLAEGEERGNQEAEKQKAGKEEFQASAGLRPRAGEGGKSTRERRHWVSFLNPKGRNFPEK